MKIPPVPKTPHHFTTDAGVMYPEIPNRPRYSIMVTIKIIPEEMFQHKMIAETTQVVTIGFFSSPY